VGITALNIVEEFAMTEDVDEMRFGVFFCYKIGIVAGIRRVPTLKS
jgi:hypothetical protein